MARYGESQFRFYQLDRAPSGLFGETHVISVGIHTMGPNYKGEVYVLSQRSEPHFESAGWYFSAADIPEELATVDIDFMLEEGKQHAELLLIDRLERRAEELGNADILGCGLNLVENQVRPLVGCWVRGRFHEEMAEVYRATECSSLHRYLHMLMSMNVFRDR